MTVTSTLRRRTAAVAPDYRWVDDLQHRGGAAAASTATAKVRGATRYAADLEVPGLLHARLVLAADAHARIASIDAAAALEVPGVVAVLTAADLPIAAGGPGRAASRSRARGRLRRPAGGARGRRDRGGGGGRRRAGGRRPRPLPAVLDPEAAMAPARDCAWRRSAEGEGDGRRRQRHAAVGGGERRRRSRRSCPPTCSAASAWHGDVGRGARRRSRARVRGASHTPWVHQGYLEPQAAMAWLEPDGELVVQRGDAGRLRRAQDARRSCSGSRSTASACAATTLGGAFGGKLPLLEPLAAAAALTLRPAGARRPDAHRGLGRGQPRARPAARARGRRAIAEGELTALRGRVVLDRGVQRRVGPRGPRRRCSPPARTAGARATCAPTASHQPRRPRRLPRPRRAAGRVRARVADRRARRRARRRPDRAAAAERRCARATPALDGAAVPAVRRRRVLERARAHPLWRARASCPTARASASPRLLAGRPGAGGGGLPAWTPTAA